MPDLSSVVWDYEFLWISKVIDTHGFDPLICDSLFGSIKNKDKYEEFIWNDLCDHHLCDQTLTD